MRHQGKITNWTDEKGFGFITPDGGGHRVFAHIKSFTNRQRRPVPNDVVTYETKVDNKGRTQATNITFNNEPAPSRGLRERSSIPLMLTAFFLSFVAASALMGRLPFAVLWFYLAVSFVAFLAYLFDKSAARNNEWRTPESTLHLIALAGGWPGALAAQNLLRHKSRKPSFQIVFWSTAIINCIAFAWLFSASGSAILQSILSGIARYASIFQDLNLP